MKSKAVLDRVFREVETIILDRQHPITGLFPASTSISNHGDYTDAWVRDNVYTIVCVWALGMALKRSGETVKSDQMEQSTIKLMRGLLQSMMRQADKVEVFKNTLNPTDALHAKYDTETGLPVVADDAWGHLQIDATSLYLLMLAQMTASGLRIITTIDEVDFVQNLVYYISTAYRTPDFGIWERGNKINNGKTEINASSVGMAKAALQALDGFNLFGEHGSERAVIHVVPDAISLARTTLASLLPRESLSKEVDASVLSIIGFPAFAVSRQSLVTKTRDEILAKLSGNYGCKRFIWDGHQTVLEDVSRLYYEHSELANFEHIESEWPLFFAYLYIHALFDGNAGTAKHYREKLESLMVEVDGMGLLPELYYLPSESIAAEKKQPHSQTRLPNDNLPLVWAQSLYLTGLLLDEGLLRPDDLDMLNLRRRATKFVKSQIALVVLAEDNDIKSYLALNGVIAESLNDIKPIATLSAPELVNAYRHVGANPALKLTGRPARRLQSLGSSQTYEINGKVYLCLSWLQSEQEDYRMYDARWISDCLAQEIEHIRKNWINSEVAVFTLLLDRELCGMPQADKLFNTLRNLQLRTEHEHVGYASASLAYRASRVNRLNIPGLMLQPLKAAEPDIAEHQAPDLEHLIPEAQELWDRLSTEFDGRARETLKKFLAGRELDEYLGEGADPQTLRQFLQAIYVRAQRRNDWLVARYCFACLNHSHIDLAGSLAILAVRHLVIVIGEQNREFVVSAALTDLELLEGINRTYTDPVERTLTQEMLSDIGSLVRTQPTLFDGLRSIHLQSFMRLCLRRGSDTGEVCSLDDLGVLPPSEIMNRLQTVLATQREKFSEEVSLSIPFDTEDANQFWGSEATNAHAVDTDWFEWRLARGLVTRFDGEFLRAIWQSLAHTDQLVFGGSESESTAIDCQLVRSSMTPGEESFAQLIDRVTQQLQPAYYKSAVVEALHSYTRFCQQNPEAYFDESLVLSEILEAAAHQCVTETRPNTNVERDMDFLLQQSPQLVQTYVMQVLEELARVPQEQ